MHRTGQVTKGKTGLQRAADGEKRQNVFCDIPWEHPAEVSKRSVGRDVVFTLQKRLLKRQ